MSGSDPVTWHTGFVASLAGNQPQSRVARDPFPPSPSVKAASEKAAKAANRALAKFKRATADGAERS
jgi:hypothetical protein